MRGRPRGSRDLHGRAVRSVVPDHRSPRWQVFCRAFGEVLSARMRDMAIASSELAAAISRSVLTVCAWRRGRSVPCMRVLVAVAGALGCTVADLLPDEARYL